MVIMSLHELDMAKRVSDHILCIDGRYVDRYRTPIFAIHKEGHYGSIVGNGFATMVEFHKRVLEAKPSSSGKRSAHGSVTMRNTDSPLMK